jgi:hypothetical protein
MILHAEYVFRRTIVLSRIARKQHLTAENIKDAIKKPANSCMKKRYHDRP